MIKSVIAILLALAIGAACRWFEVPVPAPPKLFGALLIIATTLGYIMADTFLSRRTLTQQPAAAAVVNTQQQSPKP